MFSRPRSLRRPLTLVFLLAMVIPGQVVGAVRYVRPDGNDSGTGLTWAQAKRSVGAALAQAQAGDEIWVAAGTYGERLWLKREVALYGGFAGNETQRDQRDWRQHRTILDGAQGGPVVRSEDVGATPATRLDGFTVRNGRGILGGGIACTATSPTLANNIITGNVSAGPGGGICCYNGANPRILNNWITDNLAGGDEGDGGGIACVKGDSKQNLGSSPLIWGNVIARNRAEENGGGIVAKGIFVSDDGQVVVPSAPVILNNFLTANLAAQPPLGDRSLGGGAIACTDDGMAPVIANNTITANGGLQAGGILLVGGARDNPLVVNNTLVGNSGPALRWIGLNSLRLANNLIAFNTAGLTRSTRSPGGTAILTHNLIHGNAVDFDGLPSVIGTSGNLGFDPRLVGPLYGDCRLQPDSPCVNAGDPTFLEEDWVDADGAPRVRGGRVDIGADEADGVARTFVPPVVRVRPTGNDAQDGATWATAKRTVAAAIASLNDGALAGNHLTRGGEVWVQAGTYTENLTLPPYVHLYGGFRGQETSRAERNPEANVTRLDGGAKGRVLLVWGGHRLQTVDGFVLQGGRLTANFSDQGGGIECYQAGPTVARCLITGNVANLGGGVGAYGASPWISGCVLTNNLAGGDGKGWGGGLHLDRSYALVEDCLIAHNRASDGGGLYSSFGKPRIRRNEIRNNEGRGLSLHNSGGLDWISAELLQVADNLIYENLASQEGAGLYVLFCAGQIRNNLVLLNRAGTFEGGGYGGGMALSVGQVDGGDLIVANNSILGNTADYFGLNFGGGIHTILFQRANLVLANNIVAYNSSGIFNQQASPVSPVMVRNLFHANNGQDYQLYGSFGVPGGPLSHPTDLTGDPRFVSLNGDFHLQAGSPAIDAGEPLYAPDADFDQRPRPLDGNQDGFARPDLGAYEYVHPAVRGQIEAAVPTVDAYAPEGSVIIPVRRQHGLAGAVAVTYATRDDTARAGRDYVAANGQLSFAEGQAFAAITVALPPGLTATEPRSFTLQLSQPTGGASLGPQSSVRVTLFAPAPVNHDNPWGIPEDWIQEHGLELTAVSDADHDGFLDRYEYFAGTHPRDPSSRLCFTAVSRAPAGITLTWTSVPGKRYTLRRNSTPAGAAPFGQVIQEHIAATGSTTSWTDGAAIGSRAFYRIEVEP
ncbi:MAG: right-handed parallel beta-helix repeat-containing protein [Verrucomicrobiales bacterium]|nr:right-handed parallel beta-helix repeat-containing protein [Verrucomicrobiales bacterium]